MDREDESRTRHNVLPSVLTNGLCMSPQFETFTKGLVPLKRQPRVTIQKRGTISLNKAAYHALGKPGFVELLYDAEHAIMGLRTAQPQVTHAYPVRSSSGTDNGPFVISAMAFTHFYDIDMSASRRWPAYLEGDVLCADLTGPCTIVTATRSTPGIDEDLRPRPHPRRR